MDAGILPNCARPSPAGPAESVPARRERLRRLYSSRCATQLAEAIPDLLKAARDPDELIRRYALLALWQTGDFRALAALRNAAEFDADPRLRALAAVLLQWVWKGADESLPEAAAADSDPDVRRYSRLVRSRKAAIREMAGRRPRPALRSDPARLNRIDSKQEFDQLALSGTALFVVSRGTAPQVVFLNANRVRFHEDFLTHDRTPFRRDREAFGLLRYQAMEKTYLLELEGKAERALLEEVLKKVRAAVHAPVAFRPRNARQRRMAEGLRMIEPFALWPPAQSVLQRGTVYGILRRGADERVLGRNDIAIFRGSPRSRLPPVSGILMSEPVSPLTHLQQLLRFLKRVPHAMQLDADLRYQHLYGHPVRYEVRKGGVFLRRAARKEWREALSRRASRKPVSFQLRANLDFSELTSLEDQRQEDSDKFGAKSANLGELSRPQSGLRVPPGFSIPFHHYRRFLRDNGLEPVVRKALAALARSADPAARSDTLLDLRNAIRGGRLGGDLASKVLARLRRDFRGKGVFVRSSTNAEDLPGFSGAGLYTTVANVRGEQAVIEAIKTVWASIYNYEAFEAREHVGIANAEVYPAVLIQEGIDADSAGVLTTTNILAPEETGRVLIAAKKGLGRRVVGGNAVPEQILYSLDTGKIEVLTRSLDDVRLEFASGKEGLRKRKSESGQRVLSESTIRKLGEASVRVREAFGGRHQEVEWVVRSGDVYIVQARGLPVKGTPIQSGRVREECRRKISAEDVLAGRLPDWVKQGPKKDPALWERYAECRALETSDESYCAALDPHWGGPEAARACVREVRLSRYLSLVRSPRAEEACVDLTESLAEDWGLQPVEGDARREFCRMLTLNVKLGQDSACTFAATLPEKPAAVSSGLSPKIHCVFLLKSLQGPEICDESDWRADLCRRRARLQRALRKQDPAWCFADSACGVLLEPKRHDCRTAGRRAVAELCRAQGRDRE